MKINIKDKEFELHYSMRIYLLYENILGQSLNPQSLTSYTSLLVLLYSAILATLQYNHENLDLDYDEFMDWVDSNGIDIVSEFADWFIKQVNVSSQLSKKKEVSEKQTGKKSKNA